MVDQLICFISYKLYCLFSSLLWILPGEVKSISYVCTKMTVSIVYLLNHLIFLFMVQQELERRLALQEQDVAIVKTVKSEVARLPDLEKELKRLREDNAFLRSNTFLSFDLTSKSVSPFNRTDRLSF